MSRLSSVQLSRNKGPGAELLRRTNSQLPGAQNEKRAEGVRFYNQSYIKSLTGGQPIPATPARPVFDKCDPKMYEAHLARIER